MAGCKCRYCSAHLLTSEAYLVIENKMKLYFCNKEHHDNYIARVKQENENKEKLAAQKKEERARISAQQMAEEQAQKEKRKVEKDKVYWLICEIIGRKEIINTALWKEWALWNKVASNEVIGKYLEENKVYLSNVIARLDNVEFNRIRYLSTILKNKLGDYSRSTKTAERPKIKTVEETFYEPITTNNNKRRSLADLEDEF